MAKYGYVRVSTREQNLARQYEAIKKHAPDLERDMVYADKQSGKDFERTQYQALKAVLKPKDEVFVETLDRLGRNKDGIKAELAWFKEHGVTVRVLNLPSTLIDFHGQDWIGEMVNNILVEVLSTWAEQERLEIKQRQMEGIAAMPVVDGKRVSVKTGRGFGREKKQTPDFQKFFKMQKEGQITVEAACEKMGISRAGWYRRVKAVTV